MTTRGRPRSEAVTGVVLTAAIELVAEAGFYQFSMDELATRSGVAKSTIYRRWNSRAQLIIDALHHGVTPLNLVDTGTLTGDLLAFAGEVRERFVRGALPDVLPQLVGAAATDTEVRTALEAYVDHRRQPIVVIVDRAIGRGELRADVDLDLLVDLINGPILYRKLLSHEPIDDQFLQRLVEAVATPFVEDRP